MSEKQQQPETCIVIYDSVSYSYDF